MLKRRLIPLLFFKNGLIVRSEQFSYHQNLGNVVDEAQRYSDWHVDELVYIDITREGEYDLRRDDLKVKSSATVSALLRQISEVCYMPLTFGGGIRSVEDIRIRISNGADKVTLNTVFLTNPEVASEGARLFGSQCIVASIDYRMREGGSVVYVENGAKSTGASVMEWIRRVEDYGAGEILLNAIDRDGMANGYDLDTIRAAVASTTLPVIAAGGAGVFDDFVEVALETNVSAIAAGNIFHFTENSYPRAKRHLLKSKVDVRPQYEGATE